jgi:hypothetical protein
VEDRIDRIEDRIAVVEVRPAMSTSGTGSPIWWFPFTAREIWTGGIVAGLGLFGHLKGTDFATKLLAVFTGG